MTKKTTTQPTPKKRRARDPMRPIGNRVLVKLPLRGESLSEGGIVLPDNAQEAPTTGIIAAVGSGWVGNHGKRIAPDVKVGDHVSFKEHAGQAITIEGTAYIVMAETDLLGVL